MYGGLHKQQAIEAISAAARRQTKNKTICVKGTGKYFSDEIIGLSIDLILPAAL
jgi:hypothetical protein